jgi:hypothetical protein
VEELGKVGDSRVPRSRFLLALWLAVRLSVQGTLPVPPLTRKWRVARPRDDVSCMSRSLSLSSKASGAWGDVWSE